MTRVRGVFPATVACVALGFAAPRAAGAADETPELRPPIVVAVDFDALPVGALPPMPGEDDGPHAAQSQAAAAVVVKVKKVNLPAGKRKKPRHGSSAKTHSAQLVEISPARPEICAMYVPSADGTDFEGEAVSRMEGHRGETPGPVRWETLSVGPGGDASLEIKDLWFDSERRLVTQGSDVRIALKAVAWEDGKPWLFAMRGERAVTFVMPRTSDVSAEAMVGAPLSVRGGFTRVSLPIGRWGSSSLVAHLPSLELKAPAPPTKAGEGRTDDPPFEVAVELVQTMSEESPSVLVRRSRPDGENAGRANRDD